MDLREYERAKFELAELLRAVALLAKGAGRDTEELLHELFARLAEDRFNLVVVGRFSRGKTSLMNAILGTAHLPVGIVPLTSVITTVGYGSTEKVIIHYQERRLPSDVPLDALPEYITQRHNPGNVRQVKTAEVQLPAEILRRGFYFIDTPGLGSPIRENTRTTEGFLPEADAFVLVTSYESPLSMEELEVLRTASASARRVFVVLNKQDTVLPTDRAEALAYVRDQLTERLGHSAPKVFSVSAQEALAAKRTQDNARLTASGIAELEAELVAFLVTEKSTEFLLRLCDRISRLVCELAPAADKTRLAEQLSALSKRIAGDRGVAAPTTELSVGSWGASDSLHDLGACEICERVLHASFDFLSHYQYDLSFSPTVQRSHAERGGFCAPHTWRYATVASPHGICTGYPALLDRLSERFRGVREAEIPPGGAFSQMEALLPTESTCPLCRVCANAETEAVAAIAGEFAAEPENALESRSAVCLPHLRLLVSAIADPAMICKLMEREALLLGRLSEDMRRYATKHDAIRRYLASDEEINAGQRALAVLAGLRHVNPTPNSRGATPVVVTCSPRPMSERLPADG